MQPQDNNQKKSSTPLIAALAIISLCGVGGTAYLYDQQKGLEEAAQVERSAKDQALAEQHATFAKLTESQKNLGAALDEKGATQEQLAAMEGKLHATEDRAAQLERLPRTDGKQARELAELKQTALQLRDQLANAAAKEQELQASADRSNAERDALARQMEQLQAAAHMVNNAELTALKGKKGKLTVKARRTTEVRMAFDLPEDLAKGANYKVTTPKGQNYTGASPAIAAVHGSEETASMTASGKPSRTIRSSRVDLSFKPKGKLEPGVYKIDVSSGTDYLQTVYLRLR